MGVEVLKGEQGDVFICNTTDTAFGPLMENETGEEFLESLSDDPRVYDPETLSVIYAEWLVNYNNGEIVTYE